MMTTSYIRMMMKLEDDWQIGIEDDEEDNFDDEEDASLWSQRSCKVTLD